MVLKEGKQGKIKRKDTELWVEMMVNQFRHKAVSVQRMLPVNMDEKINQNKGGIKEASQTRHTLTPTNVKVSSSTALFQFQEGRGRNGGEKTILSIASI
jgi:hypothetical protein